MGACSEFSKKRVGVKELRKKGKPTKSVSCEQDLVVVADRRGSDPEGNKGGSGPFLSSLDPLHVLESSPCKVSEFLLFLANGNIGKAALPPCQCVFFSPGRSC